MIAPSVEPAAERAGARYSPAIWILLTQAAVTYAAIFAPIVYLLYADVGLSQGQIGILEAAFGFSIVVFEFPTGYLGDRLSHRWSNVAGNAIVAWSLLAMAFAGSFVEFLIIEIVFGLGISLGSGSDAALLRAHAQRAGLAYRPIAARLEAVKFGAGAIGALLGGVLGAQNLRGPHVVQGVMMVAVTVLAIGVVDLVPKRGGPTSPLADIRSVAGYCLRRNRVLFDRIVLAAMLTTSNFLVIWFITPVLVDAGLEISWHGLVYALIAVAGVAGAERLSVSPRITMATPLLVNAVLYLVVGWHANFVAVAALVVFGATRGINLGRHRSYVQAVAPDDMQASAVSLYGTVYKLISGLLLIVVNFAANDTLRPGLWLSAAVCILFWFVQRTLGPNGQNGSSSMPRE